MNFRIYKEISDLKTDEDIDLFPPRFIIDVLRRSDNHSCMLHCQCKIYCNGKDENLIFDNLFFNINVPAKGLLEAGSSIVKSK